MEKLRSKIRFLKEIGFSQEEAAKVCGRMPAIFGYSVEENLWPKYEYLVKEMERDLEELKGFPQYFGFSLEGRIMPPEIKGNKWVSTTIEFCRSIRMLPTMI